MTTRALVLNEHSLEIDDLFKAHRSSFSVRSITYGGGLAYLLVFSSLILRIPLWAKRYYSPCLLWVERRLQRFCNRRFSCYVVCQLQRH
jgi:hypothetical protein